jgi:hypothetical protein
MAQIPTKLRALLKEKGPKRTFKEGTLAEFSKMVLSLVTVDDQMLFVEVRNRRIEELDNIPEGAIVNVDFIFAGSEKNGKRYNNLIVTKISRI